MDDKVKKGLRAYARIGLQIRKRRMGIHLIFSQLLCIESKRHCFNAENIKTTFVTFQNPGVC